MHMDLALQEKISLMIWWAVAIGITIYLALGAIDTIMVVLE